MQPQANPTPPASSGDPYGFIFQNGQKKPKLGMPQLKFSKPVIITGAVMLLLLGLVVVSSLGSKGSGSPLTNIAAQQTEILRVNDLAGGTIKDPQVLNLNYSVKAVLTSDRLQLAKYLGIKPTDGSLNKYLNKATDTQLTTAGQNNNYQSVYLTYLKQSLTSYESAIKTAEAKAPSAAQPILTTSESDAQTLLADPQFKNL